MTASELAKEAYSVVEAKVRSIPSPAEFEFAYQVRVVMDRIRFAIKHVEQFAPRTDEMREAALQLLDALERLESTERRFQNRSRTDTDQRWNQAARTEPVNGNEPTRKEVKCSCSGHQNGERSPGGINVKTDD